MTMADLGSIVLAAAAGVVLGIVFYGGLWWTVRKLVTSPNPAVWALSSLLLRMAVAVSGFYLVSGGQWQRLLACIVGFVIARFAVTRVTRPARPGQSVPSGEFRHAA